MKKILLGAFALFAAMAVNAQVEIALVNQDESVVQNGKDDDGNTIKVELKSGDIVGASEDGALEVYVKFDDSFQANSVSFGLTINDVEVESAGIQGTTNGEGACAKTGDYPTTGCIYAVTPKADGYLYFIHKPSYSKNYVVFEEHDRIPYKFTMYDTANDVYGEYDLSNGYTDVIPVDDDGTNLGNVASYWNEDYSEWMISDGYPIQQAQYYDVAIQSATGSPVGVIAFPVVEGLEYLCFATGSKMSLGYVVYSPTDDITIISTDPSGDGAWENEQIYPLRGTNTGISNPTVISLDKDGKIYNIAGQRLSTMGKGINIVNGQKILVK